MPSKILIDRFNRVNVFTSGNKGCQSFSVISTNDKMSGQQIGSASLFNGLTIDQINPSSQSVKCWHSSRQGTKRGINLNNKYKCDGKDTGFFVFPAGIQYAEVSFKHTDLGSKIPVRSGKLYCFAGLFAAVNAEASVRVKLFAEKTDDVPLYVAEETIDRKFKGGSSQDDYQSVYCSFEAPKAARYASITIVHNDKRSNVDKDSAILVCSLSFGEADRLDGIFGDLFCTIDSTTWLALIKGEANRFVIDLSAELLQTNQSLKLFNEENSQTVSEFDTASFFKGTKDFSLGVTTHSNSLIKITADAKNAPSLLVGLGGAAPKVLEPFIGDDSDIAEYYYKISTEFFDDQYHLLKIHAPRQGRIFQDYFLFPRNVDALDKIENLAKPPFNEQASRLAGRRYPALRTALKHVRNYEEVQQLNYAHSCLMSGPVANESFGPLTFPKVQNPTASIIVYAQDNFAHTYNCLCSILVANGATNFEVIVVDDASTDQTETLQDLVTNVTVVRNSKALGFAKSCNKAGKSAAGQYLVFLDSHAEPCTRWLDELTFCFNNFDAVGLVGSKILDGDGDVRSAGGIVWEDGTHAAYGNGDHSYNPKHCYTRHTDFAFENGLMIAADFWRNIGMFSADYRSLNFAAMDLAFKTREAGLHTLYAPMSEVVLYRSPSRPEQIASDDDLDAGDQATFHQRWQTVFEKHGPRSTHADLEKDRNTIGRVLFVDFRLPRYDMDAGSYAALQEIRTLQALGYKVSFLPLELIELGKYADNLRRMGVEVIHRPAFASAQDFIANRGFEFDAIYITRYNVAQQVLGYIDTFAPKAKKIFCNADLHYLRELRAALVNGDESKLQSVERVRRQETDIMLEMDVTLSYSNVERDIIMASTLGKVKTAKCPWVVECQDTVPAFSERDDIAFFGSFGHAPNKEALLHFADEVLPLLLQKKPELKVYVYGSEIDESIRALANENLIIVGYVNAVDEVYNSHKALIVPLLSGAGLKGKVMGAFAHGMPSILSPVAHEGSGAHIGTECLVAQTPDEWLKAIDTLTTDGKRWAEISKAGQNYVNTKFNFDVGTNDMKNALKAAGVVLPAEELPQQLVLNSCVSPLE